MLKAITKSSHPSPVEKRNIASIEFPKVLKFNLSVIGSTYFTIPKEFIPITAKINTVRVISMPMFKREVIDLRKVS